MKNFLHLRPKGVFQLTILKNHKPDFAWGISIPSYKRKARRGKSNIAMYKERCSQQTPKTYVNMHEGRGRPITYSRHINECHAQGVWTHV